MITSGRGVIVGLFIGALFGFYYRAAFGDGDTPVADGAKPAANNDSEDCRLSNREAEWLALENNLFNDHTLEADVVAAKDISDMLMAIRATHPSVANIHKAEGSMPDSAVEMMVSGQTMPYEVTELINGFQASRTNIYGARQEDPFTVILYFYRLLHLPSLTKRLSASDRISNIRRWSMEADISGNAFTISDDVSAEKTDSNWRFVFTTRDPGDAETTTYHQYYFTVTLDAAARSAEIQPSVIGHGMKIENAGEYGYTIDKNNTKQEWGAKPW